jgi:hypothetical protein
VDDLYRGFEVSRKEKKRVGISLPTKVADDLLFYTKKSELYGSRQSLLEDIVMSWVEEHLYIDI